MSLEKIYDFIFVGSLYPERRKILEKLETKFKVKVFSNLFGEEMVKVYNQSKIVFNKSAAGETNLCLFEALSCGSFLISDRLAPEVGLEDLLVNKKHLILYDTENDLMGKVAYYLSHEQERETIAEQGRNEVLNKHTYRHRALQVLEKLKKI